jgi:hypothetical protein
MFIPYLLSPTCPYLGGCTYILVIIIVVVVDIVGVILITTTKFRVSRDEHLQLLQKFRCFLGPAACSRMVIQNQNRGECRSDADQASSRSHSTFLPRDVTPKAKHTLRPCHVLLYPPADTCRHLQHDDARTSGDQTWAVFFEALSLVSTGNLRLFQRPKITEAGSRSHTSTYLQPRLRICRLISMS